MTEIFALNAFDDNYIWVLRANGHAVVVDPGDAAPVLDWLAKSGDRLCAILATHHHGDHVGGAAEILARHPSPYYGPDDERIAGLDRPLTGGEHLRLPEIGVDFQVLAVPGHTRSHLAYYDPKLGATGALFCGDTLFGAGCGRIFDGTPAQMQGSLARLAALPAPTLVYCAHEYTQANLRFAAAVEPGNPDVQRRVEDVAAMRTAGHSTVPSTIGIERETNPFLRWDAPAVRDAAAHRLGRPPVDPIETFAAIREWKNGF